jgi:hypothetical protein
MRRAAKHDVLMGEGFGRETPTALWKWEEWA